MAKATATVYRQEYDYRTSKNIKTKLGSYQTDDHGYFKMTPNKDNRNYNFYVDITFQNDRGICTPSRTGSSASRNGPVTTEIRILSLRACRNA